MCIIAIQLFNATATALNCISQICCLNVALISCLAIKAQTAILFDIQERQPQREDAAPADFALQGDLAVMEAGQLLRDGQAEAGRVVLFVGGGMEVSVKDSALVFRRDAAAGVLYADAGRFVLGAAVHMDAAPGGSIVDGVGDKVLDNLL